MAQIQQGQDSMQRVYGKHLIHLDLSQGRRDHKVM